MFLTVEDRSMLKWSETSTTQMIRGLSFPQVLPFARGPGCTRSLSSGTWCTKAMARIRRGSLSSQRHLLPVIHMWYFIHVIFSLDYFVDVASIEDSSGAESDNASTHSLSSPDVFKCMFCGSTFATSQEEDDHVNNNCNNLWTPILFAILSTDDNRTWNRNVIVDIY